MTAIKRTADGEFEYEPTAPYVLSQPDDDWCYAIVRTEDGEVLGTDGWQQMGVVEDATFTRDLAWIVPELNRQAEEIERLRVALYHAHVGASDDPADYGVIARPRQVASPCSLAAGPRWAPMGEWNEFGGRDEPDKPRSTVELLRDYAARADRGFVNSLEERMAARCMRTAAAELESALRDLRDSGSDREARS